MSYYQELFGSDGLFYCYDIRKLSGPLYAILEPQGIKSVLQCCLEADGKPFGMVGFDECRKRSYWSGQEIHILSLFAKSIGEALYSARAKQGRSLRDLQRSSGCVPCRS